MTPARLGQEVSRAPGIGLDFLPELTKLRAQVLRLRRVVRSPDGVEDLPIRHRTARVTRQGHQELALERRQVNLSAIDDEHSPLDVDLESGRDRIRRDVRLSHAPALSKTRTRPSRSSVAKGLTR